MSKSPLVAVSTCTRAAGVDYLPETLASLEAAGASCYPKMVFSDGPRNGETRGWPCMATAERIGPRVNLGAAIRMAANIGAERLIFFEDDVRATKNAVHRMATMKVPKGSALVSFYDMKEVPEGSRPGLYKSPARGHDGKGFWSLLGVVFPRWMLEYLADKDLFSVQTDVPHKHADRSIEDFMARSPWPSFSVHVPCLVRHVGEVSVAHPGAPFAKRQTRNYPGDAFDAEQLVLAEKARENTLVAVMTSPRPGGVQYLGKTLESLTLEGADQHDRKVVVSDGRLEIVCPWPTDVARGPSGTIKALWRLFQIAARAKAERLVFFEDDVEACRNAVLRVLGQPALPGLAATSYFDYRSMPPNAEPGFYLVGPRSVKGGPMWGLQAMSMPGEVVQYLASLSYDTLASLNGWAHGSDVLLTEVLRTFTPFQYRAQHSPCLFEHVGETSTWGNTQWHRATVWPGKDFDALSLPIYRQGTQI